MIERSRERRNNIHQLSLFNVSSSLHLLFKIMVFYSESGFMTSLSIFVSCIYLILFLALIIIFGLYSLYLPFLGTFFSPGEYPHPFFNYSCFNFSFSLFLTPFDVFFFLCFLTSRLTFIVFHSPFHITFFSIYLSICRTYED